MTEISLHQRFGSLDEAVLAFTHYSTQQGASFRVEKRDKGRLRLKCDVPDCPFQASVTAKHGYFAVVKLVPEHTCQGNAKKKRAASSRSKFLVDALKKVLVVTEDATPKAIQEALKRQGLDVSYYSAWNAKRFILDKLPSSRVAMTLRGGEGLPYSEAADRLRHSTANLPQIAQYPPVYTFALPNTATANTLIATAGSSRAPPSPTTSRSPRKSGRKPGGKNPPGHRAGGARPGAGRPRKSVASGARSSPDPSEEDDAGVAAPAVMRPLPGAQAAERMIPISSLHPAYVPFMNHPHDQGLIVLPVQAVLSMAHAYTPQAMMPFPYAFGYPPPMAGVHPAMAHHAVVNGAQHPAVHAVVSQAAVTTAEAPTTASSTPSPSTPARNADGPPSRKRRRTEPLPPPGPSSAFVEGSDRQRRKARTCRICIKAGHPETSHSCPGRGSRVLCPYNPDNQNANTEQDDDQDADGEVVPADEMDDLDPDLQDEAAVNALTFPTAQTTSVASTSSTVPPSAYGYPQPVHMLGPNGQPHPLYQTTYPFAFQGAYPAPARMANMPGQPPGAVQMIQGQVPVAGSVVYVASTPQRERASKRGPRHCVVCNLTGHPEEGATCPGRGSRRLCQYYVPEQHANHDDTSIEGQLGGQMDSLLQQS